MKEPRRIQITHVHKADAFFSWKDDYIGLVGTFKLSRMTRPGYYSGRFRPDDQSRTARFLYAIRYRRV